NTSEKIHQKNNELEQKDNRVVDNNISSKSKNKDSGTRDGTSNGTSADTAFNRELVSNTPDSRLNISANDGQSIIEYASQIEEDSTKANNTSTNKTNEKTNTNSE